MNGESPRPEDALARLLAERHSCRAFLPEPVPAETIKRVFEMAQRTASWCNTQPWQVYVASGDAARRLSAALTDSAAAPPVSDLPLPEGYPGVYGERRKQSGHALYAALGIERGDHAGRASQAMKNFSFFGAPHVAVITSDRSQGVYGAVDCGGYVTTLMLAAQSLGVATVAQASIAMRSDVVREFFGLEDDRVVVCAVAFGYGDTAEVANAFRTPRAAVDEAVAFLDA